MNINVNGNGILFKSNNIEYFFPKKVLYYIVDDSSIINVRILGKKTNLLSFGFDDIDGKSFDTVEKAMEWLSSITNN